MKTKIKNWGIALSLTIIALLSINGCSKENNGSSLPVVTTTVVSNITDKTATSGGVITKVGGSDVIDGGVCFSKSKSPTINDTKVSGCGKTSVAKSFATSLTGLEANTTYYIRAYTTNSNGTSYGNEISFTTKLTSSLKATIAGVSFTATLISVQALTDETIITATDGSKTFMLWMLASAPVGDHSLLVDYMVQYLPASSVAHIFSSNSGTINIAVNNSSTGEIKGTFNCVLSDGNTTVNVTNGQFDVYK